MKKFTKHLITLSLFFSASVYPWGSRPVYTIYNDNCAPCYKSCPFMGIYADVNIGHSWFNLGLHRPNVFGLDPVTSNFIKETSDSFIAAIGYDFYPCSKMPFRVEVNYLYADENFRVNTLFVPPLGDEFVADDRFLVRNTVATLYFDWHTCTRFVPYIGISGGYNNFKTYHHPVVEGELVSLVFDTRETNFSWGATLGSRYFFTNYLFANLQLRYDNLGRILFRNFSLPDIPLPDQIDYQSDYVHETTVMLGMGFVF